MPRIRSIKPEFFASEDVSALPLRARLTWIGLWTQCDDHGRTKDQARIIKGAIWPLDDVSLRHIEEDLMALEDAGRIVRYEFDRARFLAVVNWHYHQKPNRVGKPKHPAPPVPVKTPGPGEEGHCALCWTVYATHLALSESSMLSEPSLPVDNFNMDVSAGQRITSEFSEPSLSTHGALTSVGESRGGERRGGRAHARSPVADDRPDAQHAPPLRCPKHRQTENPPPCRACGEAREARERFDAAQRRAVVEARSAAARLTAADRAAAIANCGLCDDTGYRGRQLCDHDPGSAARAARGRAAVQAALSKHDNPEAS